jgi:hypothetical protein
MPTSDTGSFGLFGSSIKKIKNFEEAEYLVHDRSSAHFAAWHSPKRELDKLGDHFKLDDCRVWLRIHFWACRKAGLFPPTASNVGNPIYEEEGVSVNSNTANNSSSTSSNATSSTTTATANTATANPPPATGATPTQLRFQSWYLRFLSHFVRIYERTAPVFAPCELAWSGDAENLSRYEEAIARGEHGMGDIVGGTAERNPMGNLSEREAEWVEENEGEWPYGG